MKKENTNKEHLLDKLPVHQPKAAVWQKIERDLETSAPITASPGLLKKMPLHTPPLNVWKSIEKSLVPGKSKTFKIARGVTTGVLLILIIFLVFNAENRFSSRKNLIYGNLPVDVQIPDTLISSSKNIDNKPGIAEENVLSNSKNIPLTIRKEDVNEKADKIDFFASDQKIENLKNSIPERKAEIGFPGKNEKTENYPPTPVSLLAISGKQLPIKASSGSPSSIPQRLEFNYPKQRDFIYEAGLFIRPFFAKNVSTISGELVNGRAAGISFAARNSRFLLETGFIFSEIEFTDDFDIKYYSYQYLGPVVCIESFHEIQEVNEEGDTIITRQYYPEVIEMYDSTFNETEKPDNVTISKIEIPFTVGSRLLDRGRFFTDAKAGLEMAVISKKIYHLNTVNNEKTRFVAIENNQPETYTVKWKYNLALRIGYRLNEKISVFAEPFYAKYLDQMQKPDGSVYPKPEEAGLKIGLSIEY